MGQPAAVQRLKHHRFAVLNTSKPPRDGASAIATHDDDGIIEAARHTGPHQAAHGVVLDEVLVEALEPKGISEKKRYGYAYM